MFILGPPTNNHFSIQYSKLFIVQKNRQLLALILLKTLAPDCYTLTACLAAQRCGVDKPDGTWRLKTFTLGGFSKCLMTLSLRRTESNVFVQHTIYVLIV